VIRRPPGHAGRETDLTREMIEAELIQDRQNPQERSCRDCPNYPVSCRKDRGNRRVTVGTGWIRADGIDVVGSVAAARLPPLPSRLPRGAEGPGDQAFRHRDNRRIDHPAVHDR
jgi:hypothetical protein